jgi:FixJ family two-component response regulator
VEFDMPLPLGPAPPTVIVVDDDVGVLNSLRFTFEIEGFLVRSHASAEALLEGDALPDRGCLVLDYQLTGMDGLMLLKRLRDRGDDLPALLITTPGATVLKQAAAAGVSIVAKPLLCDTLVSSVRNLIYARDARG